MGCTEDSGFDTTEQPSPIQEPAVADEIENSELGGVQNDLLREFPRPDGIVDLRGRSLVEITVSDNVFDERFFRVDPGTTILFRNKGVDVHNVKPAIAGLFPPIEKEALDRGPQTIILDIPGDYPFFCSLHGTSKRGQTGYIVVGNA